MRPIARLFPLLLLLLTPLLALGQSTISKNESVPKATLIRIVSAEDRRLWDASLAHLLKDPGAAIRIRAALAAGRIGNDEAVEPLSSLLKDEDEQVRAMAAFALGEIESVKAADVIVGILRDTTVSGDVRARAVEALGKIAAALPADQQAQMRQFGVVVLDALRFEAERPELNRNTILLALTATLRARPANAGAVVAGFLRNEDWRIRADAANTLARLRAKEGNEQLRQLVKNDGDPIVRANAARVLGATEDKQAFDALLDRSLNDTDSRVRVSAIRSLAQLRDSRAAETLLKRGIELAGILHKDRVEKLVYTAVQNEVLEIVTTLGRLLPLMPASERNEEVIAEFFTKQLAIIYPKAPEVELAHVRSRPVEYVNSFTGYRVRGPMAWRNMASIAQALAETASLPDSVAKKKELISTAEQLLRNFIAEIRISVARDPEYALPAVLRALATLKVPDLAQLLRQHLNAKDVIVRATAADLLGDLPPSDESTRALIAALSRAERDPLNDAVLSIADSLGKQKTAAANEALKRLLVSHDYLVRRRVVGLLKTNGAGDFSARVGPAQTSNTRRDYERALGRIGRPVRAVVTTTKGSFTMELLPSDAPLTVDNFVRLAQRGYFGGVFVHRVVPNFVMQDGDPRGDGSGGPGYEIRCEINQIPYDRAMLGMALSGKDTGGSQWFITHSPQPHLDGGYTVFGRVIDGMDVVDSIVRGDEIRSISIRSD